MTAPRAPAPVPELLPAQPIPEGRDAKGRFAPGHPGRQPGYRHRVTMAMEDLLEGQAQALTAKAIDMAMRGDSTAMRLCLERLMPVRKGTTIVISDFPEIKSVADVPAAIKAIAAGAAAGHYAAEDAAPIVALLNTYMASVDTATFEARLAALEQQNAETRR